MNNSTHSPFQILVAEDDPDDRLLASEAFAEVAQRHSLQFVQDGRELVHYLQGRGQYRDSPRPLPHLILLDLNMPKMNGIEALQAIKADSKLQKIPVVVLTTSIHERDVAACYSLGAAAFHTKPERFSDLVALMSVLGQYWIDFALIPREV